MLLLASGALPAQAVTPDNIAGTVRINASELIRLASTTPDLVIIDARIRKDRVHGYIEGSHSLPNTETNCESLAVLIDRQDRPTVFYCNGPKCGRSVKSINIALQCGYTRIYWYRDGFEDWKERNYPFMTAEH